MFKISSFRPWLAMRQFDQLSELGMAQKDLTKKERLRIAKSCDLYAFGVSLFELMVFKSSQAEVIEA